MPKGEDISCGNMFKIGKKWMLLCISHGWAAATTWATSRTRSICPSSRR